MKKLSILFLSAIALAAASCSDDFTPSTTYRGFYNDSEGGCMYDYYQAPDTTLLIMNASNVPCDFTETVEEVPCGDTPVYLHNTYQLTLYDKTAELSIGTGAEKYDYVADKTVRAWDYHPGEYILDKTGFEEFKRMDGVYKATVEKASQNAATKLVFWHNNGGIDEVAFVKYGPFTYTELGPKRMHRLELPATIADYRLTISKDDEYNWKLIGKDVEYLWHTQDWELTQTKPHYKKIGRLSPTN